MFLMELRSYLVQCSAPVWFEFRYMRHALSTHCSVGASSQGRAGDAGYVMVENTCISHI